MMLLAGPRVANREVESRLNPEICPRRPQSFEGLEINDSDRDFSREVESRLNPCFFVRRLPKSRGACVLKDPVYEA